MSVPDTAAAPNRRRLVLIYGSCVTRDAFEVADPTQFRVVEYVARQSLISGFAGTVAPLDLTPLTSPFQRRMLEADCRGSLPDVLTRLAGEVDLVAWDLADERLGVLLSPDGSVITDTAEGRAARLSEQLPTWRRVAFGTDEHFDLWCAALRTFVEHTGRLGLLERTMLLDVPWATERDDGGPVPSSFGLAAAEANRMYARYYQEARRVGISTARIDGRVAVAAAGHRWGAAPFHYVRATYDEIVRQLRAAVDDLPVAGPGSHHPRPGARPLGSDETASE